MNRPCFDGTRSIDVMYLTQYDAHEGKAPAPYESSLHLAEPVSLCTNQQMAACVQLESRLSRAWRFSNRGMSAADTTSNPIKSAEHRGERRIIIALRYSHGPAEGCPLKMTWNLCPYVKRISSEIFVVACVTIFKVDSSSVAQDGHRVDGGPLSGVTVSLMVPHSSINIVRSEPGSNRRTVKR